MFKKKKLKKQKKTNDFLKYINYIWFIIIFLLSLIIIWKITNWEFSFFNNLFEKNKIELSQEEKFNLEQEEIFKKLEEEKQKKIKEIEKQKKIKEKLDWKKENILIIWRWGNWNDAPYLTDSLIILSYYKEKKQVSMLSIPRDLYIDYWDTDKNWKNIEAKINWLYVHYLAKYHNGNKAVVKLEDKIEEITGEKIDYYINLDFNWFIKLVNSFDWLTINVKRNLYDEKYPDNNHWFETFSLHKWIQKLYWQTALKYVRSRHNSGWDFWRSERQQQVVKAIKEKILSSEYLTSPSKIKELYDIFNKYITTDIWFIEFTKLATNIKLEDNLQFYSSTINASCVISDECNKWGFLYYPQRVYFWWQSVLLPEGSDKYNLSNYNKIKRYSDIVFNTPNLFKENYKISIFSKLKDKEDAIKLRQELKKYWLDINVLERIWNIPENNSNSLSGATDNKVSYKKIGGFKNNITLFEYNKLKNKSKIGNIEWKVKSQLNNSKISEESNNKNTKLIINWVNINSNTIKFLKNYLQIKNNNIINNIDLPKYAKDKNTKIEIIYKK